MSQNRTKNRDETFDLLSNHRRRYVLHYCQHGEKPVTLSELAEQIAAWECEKPVEQLTSAERKRTYTSLQQTHLPTLEEAGIIKWDGDTIELTADARELNVYMDIVPENSIPWSMYYLGLSGIGVGILALAWFGWLPGFVPDLGWAFVVVFLFVVSAVVHTYRSRRMKIGTTKKPPGVD